ncbi:hypothetical protein HPB49_003738 [Dermacentor silvarum]|uniref:Uncharacterized protein n=1 Tax=Dermacentor silvarum TaxID=543639 RepID=A0ACB8CDE5_DERSI|nr:hypothetical protein HPB49_003738 [Dermacentor silvarum]
MVKFTAIGRGRSCNFSTLSLAGQDPCTTVESSTTVVHAFFTRPNDVPGLLLGDAGYACMPFLMTPMADSGRPNSHESRYQAAQIRTRNTVERAFGVWKRHFPCLDMGLQHLVERSAVVTTACAALHNLAVLRQDLEPPAVVIPQHLRRQQPDVASQTDTLHGSQCRKRLIARAFH